MESSSWSSSSSTPVGQRIEDVEEDEDRNASKSTDEIFDEASGDVAVGDLDSAVEEPPPLRAAGSEFFRWLARARNGPDEARAF